VKLMGFGLFCLVGRVDELSLFERLVAHAACVLLRSQQVVELLLGKPIASESVLPFGLLSGLR